MTRKTSAAYRTRAFTWDTKAVSDDGLFSGYGSVFGVVDSYREIVAPGAFAQSLKSMADANRTLPVLWQHDTRLPIGNWTALAEDDIGLRGNGELWLDDAPEARRAWRGMKTRAITGLSIGYYVLADSYNERDRITTLNQLELVEISIVTVPANDEARIDAIKSKLAHGALPTLREFEHLLREAGFSKTQAAVIANRGLAHLLNRGEPGSEPGSDSGSDPAELVNLLSAIQIPSF